MEWTPTVTLTIISLALFFVELSCLYFFRSQSKVPEHFSEEEQVILSNVIRMPAYVILVFVVCYFCLLGISCKYYYGFTVLLGLQLLSLLMNLSLYKKFQNS